MILDFHKHDLVLADRVAIHPFLSCWIHSLIAFPVLLLAPVYTLEPVRGNSGSRSWLRRQLDDWRALLAFFHAQLELCAKSQSSKIGLHNPIAV